MIIWILISFSFSVHLFLHRPRTQNSRIIGQYTHNLLGLKTLSFSVLLFIHKNMDKRFPNWVRHAKCTWSSLRVTITLQTIPSRNILTKSLSKLGYLNASQYVPSAIKYSPLPHLPHVNSAPFGLNRNSCPA